MSSFHFAYVITLVLLAIIIVATVLKALRKAKLSNLTADIVIVGGGTAGCVVARRLHDKYPRKKIVMLERGEDHRNDPIVYNVANALTAAYTAPYSEVLIPDFPGVVCSVANGVAGGSSHNFGLAVKGSPGYWDRMRRLLGLSAEELGAFFVKVEAAMRITRLPVAVDLVSRIVPFASLILVEGAEIIHQAWNVLRNTGPLRADDKLSDTLITPIRSITGVKEVSNYNDHTISISRWPNLFLDSVLGVRWSASKAYLSTGYLNISAGDNLRIVQSAKVKTVSETGVLLEDGHFVCANDKIIMCAGGIYTPFILLNSGYQVSSQLINHYGCSLVMAIKGSNDFSSGPVGFLPRGTSGNRDWELVISGSVLTNLDFLKAQSVDVESLQSEGYNFITCLLWILDPKVRGSVSAEGSTPTIKLNLFDNQEDCDSIVDGLRFLGRFASQLEWHSDVQVVFPPQRILDRNDNAELLQYAKLGVSLTDHYTGTCRIGDDLDQNFKLRGSEKIHVVDASAIPEISDGNTEFPVLMFSEIACSRL